MGAYATAFPGGVPIDEENAAALAQTYGIPVGVACRARRRVDDRGRGPGAARGPLFERRQLPRRPAGPGLRARRARTGCRSASTRTSSCRARCSRTPARSVVLLPACTRYEQRGGGTETTTERRIIFSPEIPGPRIGEARSEWEIFADLGRRVRPDRAHLLEWPDADAIRDEIAARRAAVRRGRAPRQARRPGPVGRDPPLRRRPVRDARRQGPVHRRRADLA